ncbi:MAG: hypothetical protein ACI9N3_000780 [Colwellia sp.]|jgi:hypothetical protein
MKSKLIEMYENDLSKNVLLPLFKKIFGVRVEFTGGGIEKGRDLIVYRKDALGKNDYIGIQVKKVKATPNSTTNSFQQLLTQISQMKNEGVVDQSTASQVKFRQLYFITPYDILDRSYDSHLGAFQELVDMGVSIIDGSDLVDLINKEMPELAKKILGKAVSLENKIKPLLVNKQLMSALNYDESKNICELFCETSFVAGNKNNQSYKNKISPKSTKKIKITFSDLDYYLYADHIFKSILNIKFTVGNVLNSISEANENKKLIEDKKRKIEFENIDLREKITYIIEQSKFRNHYPPRDPKDKFNTFIKSGYEVVNVGANKLDFFAEIIEINKNSSLISENIEQDATLNLVLTKKTSVFDLTIKVNDICKSYNLKVDELNSISINVKDNLKRYLLLNLELEKLLSIIIQSTTLFILDQIPQNNYSETAQITLEKVFDTKLNIMVLGEAGSGKTTNLQMYAKGLYDNRVNELVIYMTLNQLSEYATKVKEKNIITGIHQYLLSLDLTAYSKAELDNLLKSNNTVLILDSVDEAIINYDWILIELDLFAKKYHKCQIITSSRYTVKETKQLGFVNVSLLPFDRKQKNNFFDKWFSNNLNKSKEIMLHLNNNPALDQIVTNPLSATIMATLQSSNVPLPKTEASLYRKRFELLSGLFDRFKGINRMQSQPENLLDAAKHIAFQMHLKKKRLLLKSDVVELVTEHMGDEYDCDLIVHELITPAEILLPDPDGKYGFGHLRFQEYLTSEKLVHVRDFNTSKYITTSWWHDVYVLYSQHAHEIDWLINDATVNGYTTKVKKLLSIMLSNRSKPEKIKLNHRIETAITDELENI